MRPDSRACPFRCDPDRGLPDGWPETVPVREIRFSPETIAGTPEVSTGAPVYLFIYNLIKRQKMKNFLWACLLGSLVACTPRTRVVEYPVAGARQTNLLEFYRAEVSDTALVLEGDVYHRPGYWVQVASSSVLRGRTTGKTYRLVDAGGFALDRKVAMPDSGHVSFRFRFEPVDPCDESVDYLETPDGDDGFVVTDIRLYQRGIGSPVRCRIEGSVSDTAACHRLALLRQGADLRVTDWISVPVRNGRFSYDLYAEREDVYELIPWNEYQEGSWRKAVFIAENGTVRIDVLPKNEQPSFRLQSDSPQNQELIRVQQETDSLFERPLRLESERLQKAGLYETAEIQALKKQFAAETNEAKRREIGLKAERLYRSGEAYVPAFREFQRKAQETFAAARNYELDYIRQHSSRVGLYLIKHYLSYRGVDTTACLEAFRDQYETLYPDHPAAEEIRLFADSRGIRPGAAFIDFTAPDAKGVMHTLSEEIEGKVALIDLWASWCGPCRRTSKSMIPVYEAYWDKGFTIVGVAREQGNTQAMERAVEQDGYPWLTLVDLNDGLGIWARYGVGNAGGATFLVDRSGKIVAVNPEAAEVRTYLEQALAE